MAKEAEYYLDILRGGNFDGILLTRINDGSVGRKPCDIIGATDKGRFVGIEVKLINAWEPSMTTLGTKELALFEPHQLAYLREYGMRNALSFGIIIRTPTKNSRVNVDVYVYRFTPEQDGKFIGSLKRSEAAGFIGWRSIVPDLNW